MKGKSIFITIFIFCACSGATDKVGRSQAIAVLEANIDSVENGRFGGERYRMMIDSLVSELLEIDSTNLKALKTLGINAFNDRKPKEAIYYLNKVVDQQANECFIHVLLGWSYERIEEVDSSRNHFKAALTFDRSQWKTLWLMPQIVTVIQGKQAGLDSLESIKSKISELFYYQSRNGISTFDGGGLSSIYFPPFFDLQDTNYFYINIPEELYASGLINSREKVETVFSKLGANVAVTSSYSSDRGLKMFTTAKYLQKLMSIDTLSIKKL